MEKPAPQQNPQKAPDHAPKTMETLPAHTRTPRSLRYNEALPNSGASMIMVSGLFHLFLFMPVIVETAIPAFITFYMVVAVRALFRGLQCS